MPVEVEAGKIYYWCACGRSATQPFCDGAHQGHEDRPGPPIRRRRPARRSSAAARRRKNEPLCDGSHKDAFVSSGSASRGPSFAQSRASGHDLRCALPDARASRLMHRAAIDNQHERTCLIFFSNFSPRKFPPACSGRRRTDLKRLVTNALVERGLIYEGAASFATPRRLALHIVGLPAAPARCARGAKRPARRRAGGGDPGLSEERRPRLARSGDDRRRTPRRASSMSP